MSTVGARTKAACDALGEFDSPTVSNAIEPLNLRDHTTGFASLELRCQYPELRPMVGYAVTCLVDTTTPGPKRPSRMHDLFDLIEASPKPCVVVGQAIGPSPSRSCMIGDNLVALWARMGVVGVVTDCGNRDGPRIREVAPTFQVFSPGWVVSHGNASFMDVNVPVSVCGLSIAPGDLLHGDGSGLLTVPIDRVDDVLSHAARIIQAEIELMKFLQKPDLSLLEVKARMRQ